MLLIGALIMALVVAAGVVRMMGQSAVAAGNLPDAVAQQEAHNSKPSAAYARRMCAACGVVSSLRVIQVSREDAQNQAATIAGISDIGNAIAQPTLKYEILVSMADGSSRVFEETNPSVWRVGDRLIYIDAGQ